MAMRATTGTEIIDVGPASSVPVATATPNRQPATTNVGSGTTLAADTTPAGTTAVGTTTTVSCLLTDVPIAFTSVTDLDGPIVLAPRSGDDVFYIGERRGVVYAVSDERGDVVLDISDRTTTDRERLLGLAFSPDARFYVSSTDDNGDSVIEEYLVDSDGVADVETRRTVITVEQPFGNHNGGHDHVRVRTATSTTDWATGARAATPIGWRSTHRRCSASCCGSTR